MRKKVLKTLVAVSLCTAMLGSTASASFSGILDGTNNGGTITGDPTVVSPKLKVVVPTSLVFAFDPFEQKGQSGIYSEDFGVINKSNVDVRVDMAVSVSPKTGVTLKQDPDEVVETNTDKIMYIAAEIPSAVTETAANAAAYDPDLYKSGTEYFLKSLDTAGAETSVTEMKDTTAVKGTYTNNSEVALGNSATTLTFALKAATYQDYFKKLDKSEKDSTFKEVAGTQAGTAVFRFTGKVNTKANWAPADITAKVVYNLMGLTPTNYTELTGDSYVDANAHAYVKPVPPTLTGGNIADAASGADHDYVVDFTKGSALTLTLNPGSNDVKVASVTWGTTPTEIKTSGLVTSTDTTVTVADGMWVTANAGDVKYLQVKLSNNTTLVVKLTVKAAP